MGFDMSYHPISEEEIQEWYIAPMLQIKQGEDSLALSLAQISHLEEFYTQKYLSTLKTGATTDDTEIFDKTHGFYIAITQGFFRDFFYIHGAVFSGIVAEHPSFAKYTKPWQEIVQIPIENPVENTIIENYCSGVYLPYTKLQLLLEDYENSPQVKDILETQFDYGRIEVFLKAANFAVNNGLGLLEAAEVVEPNPLDLNQSASYSDLFHCDIDGMLLFHEAAALQLAQITERENNTKKKKKGFFSNLFGK